MRETILHSRTAHYLGLVVLLLAMVVGGVITLNCSSFVIPTGALEPGQEGVQADPASGIAFDSTNASVSSARYQLSPDVKYKPIGNKPDVTIPCTWKAVQSFDNFSSATSLDDFQAADPNDVTLGGASGNIATIQKDESRTRNVKFVCEFEYEGKKHLRQHVVRVTNF